MNILVCIKQVPDDSVEIALDPKTGAPAFDGVTPVPMLSKWQHD